MKNTAILYMLTLVLYACQPATKGPARPGPDANSERVVPAISETSPTLKNGANDPTIIVNSSNPSNSVILGSGGAGGLELYSLEGRPLASVTGRSISLVDVRYNFTLAGEKVTLIVAYDSTASELVAYRMDFDDNSLHILPTDPILTNSEIEGLCLYSSPVSGKLYAFASGAGMIQQWELYSRNEQLAARQIRVLPVGMGVAHCVVHDRSSTLYFTQETVGVWRMNAEPESEETAQLIDFITPDGRYAGEIKGVAIYQFFDGGGYLVTSDADANRLQLYQLDSGEHAGTVSIAGGVFDDVEETEGLAVISMPLLDVYGEGLLVLADDDNENDNTNYKLVAWLDIRSALGLQKSLGYNPTIMVDQTSITVSASVETVPVKHHGDAADDMAIWIHPHDPQQSLIIGTQKRRGINVYDLSGNVLQELPDGRLNNVDLRYGFKLDGKNVDVVTASNRSSESIAIYIVDPATRALVNMAEGLVPTDMGDPYGLCMYRSNRTGQYYVFVNDTDGLVKQWVLEDNDKGRIKAQLVRQFNVGSQTEGCVADDESGALYIGEENVAIWKYSAEPDGGDKRTLVDSIAEGEITADVEGLAIYYAADGAGYLLASNQGDDNYAVYERQGDNKYLGMFRVVADEATGIDGISETDGLDVTSAYLGSAFPHGVFVAQDGRNITPAERQNFKFVPWERIAKAMGLELFSGYDPRVVNEDQ